MRNWNWKNADFRKIHKVKRRFSLNRIFKMTLTFYMWVTGVWTIVTLIWFWMNGFCFFITK